MQTHSLSTSMKNLNLRDLNPESRACVCCLYSVCSNTPEPSLLHCLTSTTLTFESNPSSLLAHPCLTKDNPHRSARAPCLLSSVIMVVPQKTPAYFFFCLFVSLNRATTYVKYLQQCCVNLYVYVPFYIKARKQKFHVMVV